MPSHFGPLDRVLHNQDRLLELLTVHLAPIAGNDADGVILPNQNGGEVEVTHALPQRGLGHIQERRDIFISPRAHLIELPLIAFHVAEKLRGIVIVAKEIVRLAAEDDQARFLLRGERGIHGDCVEQALEPDIVFPRLGVPRGGDDADLPVLSQQPYQPRDDWGIVRQAASIVVERDVAVKGHEADLASVHEAHELRGVQNQPDIVERRRDETAAADETALILVVERLLEQQRGKEHAHGGDKELQLGLPGAVLLMVRNCNPGVVINSPLCKLTRRRGQYCGH